jgi:hypothetical protein
MLTTKLLAVTIVIGLALAVAGVARSPASAEPADGRLVVGEHQTRSDSIYIEGYISFLRVRDETGTVVARKREPGKIHLQADLAPGSYQLTRFIRPCDGNCGYLDAPTERCRQTLTVAAGVKTHAIVNSRIGHPCEIEIRSGP